MNQERRRQVRDDRPLARPQERPPAAVGELEAVDGPARGEDGVEHAGPAEHGEGLVVQVRGAGQRVRRRLALQGRHAHAERVEPQRQRRADGPQPDDQDVGRDEGGIGRGGHRA